MAEKKAYKKTKADKVAAKLYDLLLDFLWKKFPCPRGERRQIQLDYDKGYYAEHQRDGGDIANGGPMRGYWDGLEDTLYIAASTKKFRHPDNKKEWVQHTPVQVCETILHEVCHAIQYMVGMGRLPDMPNQDYVHYNCEKGADLFAQRFLGVFLVEYYDKLLPIFVELAKLR